MSLEEGFLFGIIGGFFAEIFGLFNLRRSSPNKFPTWIKYWHYWVITLLMIASGGLLVIVYIKSGIDIKPIIAVNIGSSAPLIIQTLTAQAPKLSKVN